MAIDLASSATVNATTTSTTNVTIFDNPILNQHSQTTAESPVGNCGGADFKSTSTKSSSSSSSSINWPIIRRHHSVEGCTMKLDSSSAVVQNRSAGSANHAYHQQQKGFIEHIRRSITLSGGGGGGSVPTSLQPLTKLWLFRRQSSLTEAKRQKRQLKSTSSKSTSSSSSITATKLDSNGNGAASPSTNGVVVTDVHHQEVQRRLNGHSNGHAHHHALTHIATSNDISIHYSSATDEHHLDPHCDSSSTLTSSEAEDEIASLDKQSTGSSVDASSCVLVHTGAHEHGSLDSGVVNNDNAEEEEEDEEEEVKVLQQNHRHHHHHRQHEDIEPDKTCKAVVVNGGGSGTQYYHQHYTTSSSSSSTIVELEQLKQGSSSAAGQTDNLQSTFQHQHCRTKSEHSIVSCVSSTLEIEDEEDDEDEEEEEDDAKEVSPLQSGANSPNHSDSGHGSMSRNGEGDVATITPTPSPPAVEAASTSAAAAALVECKEAEEPLDDEQILESLRFVVRVSTRTDLSKRASIGEVFDRLDAQMRSLRPRPKPVAAKPKPKPKRRQKLLLATSAVVQLQEVITVDDSGHHTSSSSSSVSARKQQTALSRQSSRISSCSSSSSQAAENSAAADKVKQETTL